MEQIELSIIMPSLNEEKNIYSAISDTLNAFNDFNIKGEIIVIDDGSTDRTPEIIKKLQHIDNRIKLIKHHSPQGVGASFWNGVDNANKELICFLPGDNENDPCEIMRYCVLLKHVDIVIPFVFNKEIRSVFRNTLSFIYRFIINTTFLVNLNYTNGTVLYRKSLLKELNYRSRGFFFQTDILIRTIKHGYLFAEVPYRLNLRKQGVSKAVSFPSLWQVMKGYLRLFKNIFFEDDKITRKYAKDSLTEKRCIRADNI